MSQKVVIFSTKVGGTPQIIENFVGTTWSELRSQITFNLDNMVGQVRETSHTLNATDAKLPSESEYPSFTVFLTQIKTKAGATNVKTLTDYPLNDDPKIWAFNTLKSFVSFIGGKASGTKDDLIKKAKAHIKKNPSMVVEYNSLINPEKETASKKVNKAASKNEADPIKNEGSVELHFDQIVEQLKLAGLMFSAVRSAKNIKEVKDIVSQYEGRIMDAFVFENFNSNVIETLLEERVKINEKLVTDLSSSLKEDYQILMNKTLVKLPTA